jgi:glutamate-1-semialdehyde 2,1-aminomutase
MVTIGKSIAGGIPAGAYGLTAELAERILADPAADTATRATLGEVLTDEAFDGMIAIATRFTAGVQSVLDSRGLPWSIVQLGARAEYRFCPEPPRTGGQSEAAADAHTATFAAAADELLG